MRKKTGILVVLCVIAVMFGGVYGQPKDSLTVTVTTVTYGGNFAPKNAAMMWIQKGNTFIKTIKKNAASYRRHCTHWYAISHDDVDGLTGASRPNHNSPLIGKWDCTGQDGLRVTNGTYTFCVEYTENNSTGKYTFDSVVIDGIPKTKTVPDATYFKNFTAVYKPATVSILSRVSSPQSSISVEVRNKVFGIKLPSSAGYEASLVSANGKVLRTVKGFGSSATMGLQGISPGMYLLAINHAGVRSVIPRCIQ